MTDPARSGLTLYEGSRKSLGVAYLLWFFLGLLGAHRFYARAGRSGWALLALHVGGWVLWGIGIAGSAQVETQTVDDVLGTGSFTNVTFDGDGWLVGLGALLRGLAWLWWLVDAVLLPGLVRRFNTALAAGLGL